MGTAIEEAVNTVCLASVKLAAFYGLWTWLIHTVFQVTFFGVELSLKVGATRNTTSFRTRYGSSGGGSNPQAYVPCYTNRNYRARFP